MIFIFQDESKIPPAWLTKVARLQAELEALPNTEARKDFIEKHKSVWGEIKNQLLEMSHGKCWYSEAPDSVSDWHVDHFRPKKQVRDEDGTEHEGYYWLAFDWKNYRISGSYPNAPHRDEHGETRGKWDYFPLANGCTRADWEHRDCTGEVCLLLDPANRNDPKLMTFDEGGVPLPVDPRNPIVKKRVETTVHYLYLDSPRLIAARKRKWRDTLRWIDEYLRVCPDDFDACTQLDHERLGRHFECISELTGPETPYAATARACLRANGLDWLIPRPEEVLAA